MQSAKELLEDLQGVTPEMLEAAARLPDEMLQMYRLVAQGGAPPGQYWWIKQLRDKNPRQFVQDLRKYETEWRAQMRELGPAAKGPEPEKDKQTVSVLELIGKILDGKIEAGTEES